MRCPSSHSDLQHPAHVTITWSEVEHGWRDALGKAIDLAEALLTTEVVKCLLLLDELLQLFVTRRRQLALSLGNLLIE